MGRYYKISLVCCLFFSGLIVYMDSLLRQPITLPASNYYLIPPGSSLYSVTDDLTGTLIVRAPSRVFKAYGALTRYRGTIKAGEYELTSDLDAKSLLQLFRDGKVAQRQITFPEGWRFSQWRHHLRANELLEHMLDDVSESTLMARLGSPVAYAEGQFFPDTYLFTRGESDFSILKRAYLEMGRVVREQWAMRDVNVILASPQELLILASIVEKETGYEPDRQFVASVFVNRLSEGMKLQSDPTVIYGLPDFNGNLRRRDLSSPSPFNTYVIDGLPPTPICNPGLASIEVSLHPKASSFYYFVARGDGRSEFSSTLAEHNAAVSQYQKASRVSDYRSVPN